MTRSSPTLRADPAAEGGPAVPPLLGLMVQQLSAAIYFGAWRREGQELPYFLALSGSADGVRASKAHHVVERLDGDLGFDLLGRPGLGAQRVADHAFKSAHGRLDLSPLIVAGAFLPTHAAARGDDLEMTVARRRVGLGRRAWHRGEARRHDHRGVGMTLGHELVNPILIVSAVRRHRAHLA